MAHSTEILIDRTLLAAVRLARAERFAEELTYFIDDGARALEQIERAGEDRDPCGVVRPAQGLKNEARSLGAWPLAALAAEIEALGYAAVRAGTPLTSADVQIAKLRPLFDRTVGVLRAELPRRSPLRSAVSTRLRAMAAL